MKLTPGMKQYMDEKQKYPDCLLLFRMGDFYECFFEDAITVSKILNITLTNRGKGETKAPLAGIPYHSLERYLGKLVNSGHKVAICEQTEDPKQAKGLVKREVVRVITPGTVVEDSILEQNASNYLAAIFIAEGYGLAFLELSTGTIEYTELTSLESLKQELTRRRTAEVLVGLDKDEIKSFCQINTIYYQKVDSQYFWMGKTAVENQYHTSADSLGFSDKDFGLCAVGAILSYISSTQKIGVKYLKKPRFYELSRFMKLDGSTIKNLELLKNIHDGSLRGSLLSVLDKTTTPMGSRLLKTWITHPLQEAKEITNRHEAVSECVKNPVIVSKVQDEFKELFDIERLVSKICYRMQSPKDLVNLKYSLQKLPVLQELLSSFTSQIKQAINFPDVSKLVALIDKTIADESQGSEVVRSGAGYAAGGSGRRDIGMIKSGCHEELDELYELKLHTKKKILDMEKSEQEKTGMTLKVSYNKVFGYYIEVSNKFKDKVPDNYIRKQTLVNAERFITEDLKEFENKLLSAEQKIIAIEDTLLAEVVSAVEKQIKELQQISEQIAEIDIYLSFATVAREWNYVKPEITDQYDIELTDSRHPVIEQLENVFIPNDCHLNKDEFVAVITGPNMAGKSTYMRQVALCILMNQIGSFIPASKAKLSVVDQIFSRVGAYDDLTMGQSTFMVEMTETAKIVNTATEKSFIILDEIGRGTSTFDGVAIAWSVAEYILQQLKAKTLFATHYHVLTKLEEHKEKGIVNYNIAVTEDDDKIVFLRKIKRGGTDKSYGVHVAKLAGLPDEIIKNALTIQDSLESDANMSGKIQVKVEKKPSNKNVDGNQKQLEF